MLERVDEAIDMLAGAIYKQAIFRASKCSSGHLRRRLCVAENPEMQEQPVRAICEPSCGRPVQPLQEAHHFLGCGVAVFSPRNPGAPRDLPLGPPSSPVGARLGVDKGGGRWNECEYVCDGACARVRVCGGWRVRTCVRARVGLYRPF